MIVTPSCFCRAQLAARSAAAVASWVFSSVAPDQKLSSACFSSRRGPMRGVPSVATAMVDAEVLVGALEDVVVEDMWLTPIELGAKAEVTRLDSATAECVRESQPHHRDTPPEDV